MQEFKRWIDSMGFLAPQDRSDKRYFAVGIKSTIDLNILKHDS